MRSLRVLASLWIMAAMLAGAGAAVLWMKTARDWQSHLERAEIAGQMLAHAVLFGAPPPVSVRLEPLPPAHPANHGGPPPSQTDAGLPASGRVTSVLLRRAGGALEGGPVLQVQVVAARALVPVSGLGEAINAATGLGAISQRLARYCDSRVVLFLRVDVGPWWQAQAPGLWTCDGQPRDFRLVALGLAGLALVLLIGHAQDVAQSFRTFARALQGRRGLGPTADFLLSGPDELRQTVSAVNAYLADERDRLARRAMVLSGISHDLGTPATRLKLRAALIGDEDLRAKFETDIDRMTRMIEEVLAFTRAEIGAEAPRDLSLRALVESVVAEYQDMGRPVSYSPPEPSRLERPGTVFGPSRGAALALPDTRRVLLHGQPLALERALSNLIDNALKYGRKAHVSLATTSAQAEISVQDEGGEISAADLEALTRPFARGPNATASDGSRIGGHGMGLSIVATIVAQHGGTLEFDSRPGGLCARMILPRGTDAAEV